MKDIFGIAGDYRERCAGLVDHELALWDVLRASVRPGSLDADIRLETAAANDFGLFLHAHTNIEKIVFNGKKAEQLFRNLVPRKIHQHTQLIGLPSTSPAYAAMPYAVKMRSWAAGLDLVLPNC
jgi:hypoxanthine-DNA glycosylase